MQWINLCIEQNYVTLRELDYVNKTNEDLLFVFFLDGWTVDCLPYGDSRIEYMCNNTLTLPAGIATFDRNNEERSVIILKVLHCDLQPYVEEPRTLPMDCHKLLMMMMKTRFKQQ